MRLAVLGREVMNVRDAHESGRFRADRGELAALIFESGNAAGQFVLPLTGFRGSETNHQAAVAILKRADQICFMPRRAKFRVKVARLLARLQLEYQVAGSPNSRFRTNR